jgi:hypothetical protein
MRVWYDAATGKTVRYGVAIARRLRKRGHDVILTTREHPDTLALARLLHEEFTVVGEYTPTSLAARLRESVKRQLIFCDMFEKSTPEVAVSHRSVELCRIAFGLGIPVISTHDTPHSIVVGRLTMPLTDFLVVSKAMQKKYYQGYGIKRFFRFDGVDEVAWIKGFKPSRSFAFEKPLIVVRQMETKAIYAQGKTDVTEELAQKLTSLGHVVFLPRYDKRLREGLIVPKQFVDSASLVGLADLVLSVGGTLAREAALQGTPSIVIRPMGISQVNNYLSKKGFPLFTVKPCDLMPYAEKYVGKKVDVKDLLAKLEDPVDIIEKIIERDICK